MRSYNHTSTTRVRASASTAVLGLMSSILITFFPFVIRTVIIYYLGDYWLGLYGLFQSVCQILNITEFGVGEVLVYYMYAPVAKGETARVNAYMNEIRRLYRIIGTVVLLLGLGITPFIGRFVKGGVRTGTNIHLLFLIYLLFVVSQYFAEPEIRLMFAAHQRMNIEHFLSICVYIPVYALQLLALTVFRSFLLFLFLFFLITVLRMVMRIHFRNKYFPECRSVGSISAAEKEDIKKRTVSMIGHQLDTKLLNSIDNVFISGLIGLTAVAVYGNYYCVILALETVFNVLYGAILPSVGNAIVLESRESNRNLFDLIFWFSSCLTGWATACLICMYQMFIVLWVGSDHAIEDNIVLLFVLYFYISQIRKTVVTFKNADGMWYNDRIKPYVSMALDLVLDIVLIRSIGIAGAITSSIICLAFVEIPWETRVLFRDYFHSGAGKYVVDMVKYGVVNAAVILLSFILCRNLLHKNSVMFLLLRLFLCSGVSFVVFLIVYGRSRYLKTVIGMMKGLLFKKT